MATIIQGEVLFGIAVTNVFSVDSTNQTLLLTGSGDLKVFLISNPSVIKFIWLKPDDNTVTKQGIILGPMQSVRIPITIDFSVYGIMDSGGAVDISVVEFS